MSLLEHFAVKKTGEQQGGGVKKSSSAPAQASTRSTVPDHAPAAKPQQHQQGKAARAASPTSPRSFDLDTLRKFDLDPKFGPCIGLSRRERFQLAVQDGLSPPAHVLSLVDRHAGDVEYEQCIWYEPAPR
eukprot:m.479601 g.479601  ORF g.479601 m.479601 type:complete len:130 (+) comp21515_c0_seq1:89-478(+)